MFKVVYDGSKDSNIPKNVFPKTLSELMDQDERVVYLDADLMSSFGTAGMVEKYAGRAFDVGVQEANMIGMAAGMSTEGKIPYVHTFGPFASRRVYDQVFLSVAYAHNNVRIIGTDPGVTAAYNGGTHMPFEDVALYRAIPEAIIFDIADSTQFREVLKLTKDVKGCIYIRTPRKSIDKIYSDDSTFEIGKGHILREGTDVTIVGGGIMVGVALAAAEKLAEEGINAEVIDPVTVKPLDEDLIIASAKKTGAVVTAENCSVNGGLGEAVASVLGCNLPTPMRKVGIHEECGEVGTEDYLRGRFNLAPEEIIKNVKEVLAMK